MQTRTHKYQHQNPPVISSDSVWVSLVLVQSGSVLVCFGLVRSGSLWFNLVQSGSIWFRLVWSGLGQLSLVCLTSLPMRSSLFSMMPHGAMPIAQTFPLDFDE